MRGADLKSPEDRSGAPGPIQVDFFGSDPRILVRSTLRLGRDFDELGISQMAASELDPIGFWEALIWDCPLETRSIDSRVHFLPAAATSSVNPVAGVVSSRQRFGALPELRLSENARVDLLDRLVQASVRKLLAQVPRGERVLLPLSGGLDSRLIAVHLAQSGFDRSLVDTVTFALSRSSREYTLAAEVARSLGFCRHFFHEVRRDGYVEHAASFWKGWRGTVSVAHSHLYGFLEKIPDRYGLMLSGLLGDPLAGYAALPPGASGHALRDTGTFRRFVAGSEALRLERDVQRGIRDDLDQIYERWRDEVPLVEFDEYFYHTQRQPKTFGPLVRMYRKILPVGLPFSDPSLIAPFLSAPYELRAGKRILRLLLHRRSPNLASLADVSSALSSFTVKTRATRLLSVWSGRFSVVLSLVTNDRIRWFSPYGTEDVYGAARREFRPQVLSVLNSLRTRGIVSSAQFEVLRHKPVRSNEVGRHARLLTFLPWFDGPQNSRA